MFWLSNSGARVNRRTGLLMRSGSHVKPIRVVIKKHEQRSSQLIFSTTISAVSGVSASSTTSPSYEAGKFFWDKSRVSNCGFWNFSACQTDP
jgi:hypothetical protein